MNIYPYKRIKTDNLRPLLFAARAITLVGYAFILVSIVLLGISIFMSGDKNFETPGLPLSTVSPGMGIEFLSVSIFSFVSALFLVIIGGLCAAVVSFEHGYSIK